MVEAKKCENGFYLLAVMLRSNKYRGLSCVENVVSQIFLVFQCTVPSFLDLFRQTFEIFSIYIVFPTKYGAVLALKLNSTMIFNHKSYRCNKNKKTLKNVKNHGQKPLQLARQK